MQRRKFLQTGSLLGVLPLLQTDAFIYLTNLIL
jgi:hypothetical protein